MNIEDGSYYVLMSDLKPGDIFGHNEETYIKVEDSVEKVNCANLKNGALNYILREIYVRHFPGATLIRHKD